MRRAAAWKAYDEAIDDARATAWKKYSNPGLLGRIKEVFQWKEI